MPKESTPISEPRAILDGVRVLDFGQVFAGPTVTRLMVELGAEVIKVEAPPVGDIGRVLPGIRDGRSGYYVQQNRGKRSICVDLKRPEGRELVLRLVPHVDVVVQNFAYGVLDRLGLGWDVLSGINERVILCNVTAFGNEGPLRDRPGFDPVAQAWSGTMHMLGYPDQTPILGGISPGDVLTGTHAFGGVAAALYHRERTGRGQQVDVSLLSAYTTAHELTYQNWSVSGGTVQPKRAGNVHPVVGAVGVFEVGDGGYVTIVALTDAQWTSLCRVMAKPELADDERFATSAARTANREATNDIVAQWVRAQPSRDEVVAAFEAARVPGAPVLTLAEAAEHPSVRAAGALRSVHDDLLGEVVLPAMPIRFSEYPDDPDLRAQSLGQDNEAIATGVAGMSVDEYDDLCASGVLHADPHT